MGHGTWRGAVLIPPSGFEIWQRGQQNSLDKTGTMCSNSDTRTKEQNCAKHTQISTLAIAKDAEYSTGRHRGHISQLVSGQPSKVLILNFILARHASAGRIRGFVCLVVRLRGSAMAPQHWPPARPPACMPPSPPRTPTTEIVQVHLVGPATHPASRTAPNPLHCAPTAAPGPSAPPFPPIHLHLSAPFLSLCHAAQPTPRPAQQLDRRVVTAPPLGPRLRFLRPVSVPSRHTSMRTPRALSFSSRSFPKSHRTNLVFVNPLLAAAGATATGTRFHYGTNTVWPHATYPFRPPRRV